MTNPRDASPQVTAELLLQVFDLPVSFHRCLVPITGGISAALMLSQAIWTTQELDPEANGWFVMSQEAWTEATGLSRWERWTFGPWEKLRGEEFTKRRVTGLHGTIFTAENVGELARLLRNGAETGE